MKYLEIDLSLDYEKIEAKNEGNVAKLCIYVPNELDEVNVYTTKRPTVLVLPGGGYGFTSEREGDPIVMGYLAHGFTVAKLYYSCAPSRYPVQLIEALSAIKHLRDNAKKYFVDPKGIYVCGFSAGGHLAASCGTLYKADAAKKYFGDPDLVRPNGMILCYPVITSGPHTHGSSISSLLGPERENDPEWRDLVSLEKQVDRYTPSSFIWATSADQAVPCENSLLFASALKENGVPFEIHIFENGPHGIATADYVTCGMNYPSRTRAWINMSAEWILEKAANMEYKIYID